jgi:trimethylamine--corrinoid protein Co-methyltransferase
MKVGLSGGLLNFLNESGVEQVHKAALELLEDPGVFSESDLVLDIFAKHGARVDRASRVVRVSREMVEAALKSAPHSFTLYGRERSKDLQIELGQVYYGMGGTSEPFFWDYDLKKPRAPTKADMVKNTRLGEALPNVDFVMALCSAGDVPRELIFFHEYDAIFRNTAKPVVVSSIGRKYTRRFLEMAVAASGGEGELRRRPWVVVYVTSPSPLRFVEPNEGIIEAAEFGVPIIYSPAPFIGATGPATLAGAVAQGIAETHFGLVLSQLLKPGIPFVFAPHSPAMDMTTTQITYGSPEQALGRAVVAQMTRFYGLPTFNTGGGVEAKLPDAEAAAEAMMGMLMNGLAGVTLTQTMGTLASGMYGSAEMLVICDEIAHMVKRVLEGVQVNDETLALEVVRDVGHNGHFLAHDHTLEFFRKELFFPELFPRQSIEDWLASGGRSITEVAHERVQEILAQAGSVALMPGADSGLERALREALEGSEKDAREEWGEK